MPAALLALATSSFLAGQATGDEGAAAEDPVAEADGDDEALLADDFAAALDDERWEQLRIHDARQDRIATDDGELVLAIDTRGTDDATVKLRGLRSKEVFEVPADDPPLRLEVTCDWTAQRNGCYLSMGVALVAAEEDAGPHAAEDALGFELIGVPPGRKARPFLWQRRAGALSPLYTEGWPQERREERIGREFGRVTLVLEVGRARVALYEGGELLHEGEAVLPSRARLVLFVTSHSNYPERAVRFEDVRLTRG